MGTTSIGNAYRWPAWANAVILLLSSWLSITALTLQARPDAEIVAVVFPPWWNAEQTLSAAASAQAAFVRATAIPAVLVVRPDAEAGLTRLRDAGAWFAIDPRAVAACLPLKG